MEGMAAILPDGRDRITSSLKRLMKLGYITVIQERDEKGKFLKNHVSINRMDILPHAENPVTENPQTDERSSENHTHYNNSNDTKTKNTKEKSEPDTLSPNEYEELVKEYGKDAVDSQIAKILERHYTGCMNKETIGTWCQERQSRERSRKPMQTSFSNFLQRHYSSEYYKDLEAKLL